MKKLGIGCLSILGILLVIGIIGFVMNNESLPKGESGAQADALAQKMLVQLNKNAWDTLNYASWSFMDQHHYICLLYTSPSPRDLSTSRMPSSA